MWTYRKDGVIVFTIPLSNIDYVKLSKGIISGSPWKGTYYHCSINKYSDSELLSVLYKKSGEFIYCEGDDLINQISSIEQLI